MDGRQYWRTSMKARVAVVGVTALGLGLYGLLGGGAKSSVVPFQGKNVSTVQTDKFSVATTVDGNGTFNAVALGPSNSLYSYWQIKGTWYGPLQISPAGTAFSGPGLTDEQAGNGNLDAAVEGPNHTLYFYWQIGTTWHGPLQIGAAGSTWSTPAITVDTAGNVDVSAQGPNGSLYQYWAIGGKWNGPLQIAGGGTTFSAPSMHNIQFLPSCSGSGTACIAVAAKGPGGESLTYWSQDGQWTAPSTSGQNQEYSTPSAASGFSVWVDSYQGPANSLITQFSFAQGGSNSYCVTAGAGTTFGAPSGVGIDQGISSTSGSTSFNLAAAGPGGSLYVYWWSLSGPSSPATCPSFYGPLQLSGAGTVKSVPSDAESSDGSGNTVVNTLVEGPSHSLWLFWSTNGSWYGPLQVGGPGTTYDSAN